MKNLFIFLIIIVLLSSCIFSLSGCSAKKIDQLAYIISMGFDVSSTEKLKIYFEISTPSSMGSSSSSSKSNNPQSDSTIIAVECASIDIGLNLLNSYINKKADLSHCNIIVFSSNLAELGLHDYLYTLINNNEIKPSCDILISTCSIEDFFKKSSNTLASYSANHESLNQDLTGLTEIVSINDFFSKTQDTFGEPFAILCGLSKNNIEVFNLENNSSEIANSDNYTLKTLGLAVFKQDYLVGFLSPLETFAHLILTNKFKNCTIPIPSPFDDNSAVDIYFTQKKDTKIKIMIDNNTPVINIDVFLEGKISSISENHKYLDTKNIELLESNSNEFISKIFESYFLTTINDYGSDIGGLGKYAVCNFLTWNNWEQFNWQDKYKNARFNININTTITSSNLLLDT